MLPSLDSLRQPSVCQRKTGKNSISITPTLPSLLELNARSAFVREAPSPNLDTWPLQKLSRCCFPQIRKRRPPSGNSRAEVSWRYALHRHNSYARALWIWFETAIGEFTTFKVPDPDAPEAQKIKLQPGESVQVSNARKLRGRSGLRRPRGCCDQVGVDN